MLALLPLPAPASPAAGGALRGDPVPRRGGLACAAASLQALSPGLGDVGSVGHRSVLGGFRGDPAAPGAAIAAGLTPAAAAAGARQADFLLPPAVPVAQGRQVSAASAAAPILMPQPWRAAGASRGRGAPRARGSPVPARYPPRLSASVLSVRSVSLCSADLRQATWCLSPWTRERGPGPPPRQAGSRREGRVGRTGLEEIKETQKLPGPVPLVIPQSSGSGPAGSRAGTTSAILRQSSELNCKTTPFFDTSPPSPGISPKAWTPDTAVVALFLWTLHLSVVPSSVLSSSPSLSTQRTGQCGPFGGVAFKSSFTV